PSPSSRRRTRRGARAARGEPGRCRRSGRSLSEVRRHPLPRLRRIPDARRERKDEIGDAIVISELPGGIIMKKVLEIGGFIAGASPAVFGIVAIALALNGQSTVTWSLKAEKIPGSSDMTPAAIRQEVAGQSWAKGYDFPTASVAGKAIDS